jgi:hypothetical protein
VRGADVYHHQASGAGWIAGWIGERYAKAQRAGCHSNIAAWAGQRLLKPFETPDSGYSAWLVLLECEHFDWVGAMGLGESDFQKQCHCPSSQDLASYQQRSLANWQRSQISAHLAICDFCAAEFQLLSKFPPTEKLNECPPMPEYLRVLAESLLASRAAQESVLRQLARPELAPET